LRFKSLYRQFIPKMLCSLQTTVLAGVIEPSNPHSPIRNRHPPVEILQQLIRLAWIRNEHPSPSSDRMILPRASGSTLLPGLFAVLLHYQSYRCPQIRSSFQRLFYAAVPNLPPSPRLKSKPFPSKPQSLGSCSSSDALHVSIPIASNFLHSNSLVK